MTCFPNRKRANEICEVRYIFWQFFGFSGIGEMLSETKESDEVAQLAGAFKTKLYDCMEKKDDGSLKMTNSIPDETFLDSMAQSLARMVGAGR